MIRQILMLLTIIIVIPIGTLTGLAYYAFWDNPKITSEEEERSAREKKATLLTKIEKAMNQKENRREFESDLRQNNISFHYHELNIARSMGLDSAMKRANIQDIELISGQINIYLLISLSKKGWKEAYVSSIYFDKDDNILSWEGSTINK